MLATTTETGEPMYGCTMNLLVERVTEGKAGGILRQNSNKVIMFSGVSEVCPGKLASSVRR